MANKKPKYEKKLLAALEKIATAMNELGNLGVQERIAKEHITYAENKVREVTRLALKSFNHQHPEIEEFTLPDLGDEKDADDDDDKKSQKSSSEKKPSEDEKKDEKPADEPNQPGHHGFNRPGQM